MINSIKSYSSQSLDDFFHLLYSYNFLRNLKKLNLYFFEIITANFYFHYSIIFYESKLIYANKFV